MCWNRRPPSTEKASAAHGSANHAHETREPQRPQGVTIAKKTRRSKCKVADCGRRLRSKYESRCGLCVHHLRAAELLRDGVPSRFCQKCQKFQPVTDFEGDRKSCIEGLFRHNAKQRAARAAREVAAGDMSSCEVTCRMLTRTKLPSTSTSDTHSAQTATAAGPVLPAHCAAPLLPSRALSCSNGAERGSSPSHSTQSPAGTLVLAAAHTTRAPVSSPLELEAFVQELMRDPECDTSVWWSLTDPASMPPVLSLPTLE